MLAGYAWITNIDYHWTEKKLKADRPHLRTYPHTPNDYRHTDNHLGLVMMGVAQKGSDVRVVMDGWTDRRTDGRTDATMDISRFALLQVWEQGRTNKRTDGQTDGHYQVHILPALLELRGR